MTGVFLVLAAPMGCDGRLGDLIGYHYSIPQGAAMSFMVQGPREDKHLLFAQAIPGVGAGKLCGGLMSWPVTAEMGAPIMAVTFAQEDESHGVD